MDVVAVLRKTSQSSAHGNNIVIRMRGEHHDSLRIWKRPFWTGRIVCVRFSARPPADYMLEIVENLYVDLAGRSFFSNQVTHSVVVVVSVRKLEDRLVKLLAKPENRLADKVRSPLNLVCQPRSFHSCQIEGSSLVYHNVGVAVFLEIGCRNHLGNFSLHDFLDLRRTSLAPCQIIYLPGFQNSCNTHRYCVIRNVVNTEELAGGRNPGSIIEVYLPCP